jgi:TolA-binding protein
MLDDVIVVEDSADDDTPDDAALAYEQGLAVGAVATVAAATAELAEETAQALEDQQEGERYQWESLNSQISGLSSRLDQMESRIMETQIAQEELAEEVLYSEETGEVGGTEGEPTLEVAVPAEPVTSTQSPETGQAGAAFVSQQNGRRRKMYRLP